MNSGTNTLPRGLTYIAYGYFLKTKSKLKIIFSIANHNPYNTCWDYNTIRNFGTEEYIRIMETEINLLILLLMLTTSSSRYILVEVEPSPNEHSLLSVAEGARDHLSAALGE